MDKKSLYILINDDVYDRIIKCVLECLRNSVHRKNNVHRILVWNSVFGSVDNTVYISIRDTVRLSIRETIREMNKNE